MEAHEWGGSAPPRGDQGTGTQGSPVGRRSRLVDGDRESRVADHPQVPESGLAPRKTPTGKMASEQQAVPPLTSAALRGIAHHAADLGSTLPVLQSDLRVLQSDLPDCALTYLDRVHLCLANMCLHLEGTPASCLEIETGDGRK